MTWKFYAGSADSANLAPKEEAIAPESPAEETADPVVDELTQLKTELDIVKAELGDYQDRFLRKAAEFENFRKRTEREMREAALRAKSAVLLELLPVADACERAIGSLKDAPDGSRTLEPYREGVDLLYKQVNDVLERFGVIPIKAQGEPFDPHLHEAVTREADPDLEENTVIMELRRGYLYGDRLLRPAQVVVSTRTREEDHDRS